MLHSAHAAPLHERDDYAPIGGPLLQVTVEARRATRRHGLCTAAQQQGPADGPARTTRDLVSVDASMPEVDCMRGPNCRAGS
eukprot:1013056-Prorocentrum_lima.AAC.1